MEKKDRQYVNAAGKFLATVKAPGNGWLGEEKTGSEFVRIPVVVSEEGDQQGREVVWKGYLTEKAKLRTIQVLDEIFGTEWNFDLLAAGKVKWDGTEVRITTEEEEYQGETRYKAKWLNPAAKAAKVEPTAVGKLDALLAVVRKGLSEAFAPAPAKEADDIPF